MTSADDCPECRAHEVSKRVEAMTPDDWVVIEDEYDAAMGAWMAEAARIVWGPNWPVPGV